ncbi:MAG: hypothetical protein NC926_11030 [Candidatus Omnitrophica bacterium]|nr:hypothetical protein [Candidatus Omnitrophota bacterium]
MIIECPICKESVLIPIDGNMLPHTKIGGNGLLICLNCDKLFSLVYYNTKKELKRIKNKWIIKDDFIFTLEESEEKYEYKLPWNKYKIGLFPIFCMYCPICKEYNATPIEEAYPITIPYTFNIKGKEIFGCKICNKLFLANLKEIKRVRIRKFKKLKNKWIHKTKIIFTIEEYGKNRKDYDKCYNILQEIRKEYFENIEKLKEMMKNGREK